MWKLLLCINSIRCMTRRRSLFCPLSKMCRSGFFGSNHQTQSRSITMCCGTEVLTIHNDIQTTSKHTPESTDVTRSPCETLPNAQGSSVIINHTSVNVHWCVFPSTGSAIVPIYFCRSSCYRDDQIDIDSVEHSVCQKMLLTRTH